MFINKYQLIPIKVGDSFTINNTPFKKVEENNKYINIYQNDTFNYKKITYYDNLSNIIVLQPIRNNTIELNFIAKGMQVNFVDSTNKKQTILLEGKYKKKLFYYRIKEKNFLIPIFYSNRKLEKFKFFKTKNNEIVLDYTKINEMNIIFLAGGGTIKKQYWFY